MPESAVNLFRKKPLREILESKRRFPYLEGTLCVLLARCLVLILKHVRGNFILHTCHPKKFFPGTILRVTSAFGADRTLSMAPTLLSLACGAKRGRHHKTSKDVSLRTAYHIIRNEASNSLEWKKEDL